MFLSKSFGYALRGILYIAMMQDENRRVQIDEISNKLSVPKHFLGKIMQQVVKAGLLKSMKGPHGGFSLAEETLTSPLSRLVAVTDGMDQFNFCVLKLQYCNGENPCPLHHDMLKIKEELRDVFLKTTISDLLTDNKSSFINRISVH